MNEIVSEEFFVGYLSSEIRLRFSMRLFSKIVSTDINENLRELGMLTLKQRRLVADLISLNKNLKKSNVIEVNS